MTSSAKLKIDEELPPTLPAMWRVLKLGYGYEHLYASNVASDAFAWDTHRAFAGARLGLGYILVPTIYGHVGYGWRSTGDVLVANASGMTYDVGGALDLHIIPHIGIGAHAEYNVFSAQPYSTQWVALGLHADIEF